MSSGLLAEKIADLTNATPPELVRSILPKLSGWDRENWALSRTRALANIHHPRVRASFLALFDTWQTECPDLPGSAVELAFEANLQLQAGQQNKRVELVWTGPQTDAIAPRRTDEALLQLIASSKSSLLVVSFAVYKIPSISEALQSALQRGVDIRIILENPGESEGKISFSGENAIGKHVLQQAQLYVWPIDQRPRSEDGKFGSLHAKVALADEEMLFISSANLTEYAMNLNMEMGVLIKGGDLPVLAKRQFDELIIQGILKQVNVKEKQPAVIRQADYQSSRLELIDVPT